MIIGSDNNLQTNIPENGNNFTIAATPQAFQILSSGVYEHKIAAVVREYMTNALDSHIQANKEKVPFRVTIPCASHPYFEVEDFGIGMDLEDALRIYTQYFKSTKSTTNIVAGGFGLGGKSFLAYTKQFTIRFRKSGQEHTALVYLGVDSLPRLDVISSVKTTEGDGVKISIPVQERDYSQFEEEILFYASFYEIAPIFNKDVRTLFDNNLFYTEDQIVFQPRKRNRSALGNGTEYVLIGPVPYPISFRSIQNIPNEVLSLFRHSGDTVTFLKLNIGDVAIAASRESLSLDVQSSDFIKSKLIEHHEKLCKDIDSIVCGGMSVTEMAAIIDDKYSNTYLRSYAMAKSKKLKKYILGHTRIPNLRFKKQIGYSSTSPKFQMRFVEDSYDAIRKKTSNGKLPILVIDKPLRRINQIFLQTPHLVYNSNLSDQRKTRIESILDVELEPVRYSELYEKYKKENKVQVAIKTERRKTESDTLICSGFFVYKQTITEFRDKTIKLDKNNTFHYPTDEQDTLQIDVMRFVRFKNDDTKYIFVRNNSKTQAKLERNSIISAEDFLVKFEEENFEEFKHRNLHITEGTSVGLLLHRAKSKILPDNFRICYDRLAEMNSKSTYDHSFRSAISTTYFRKTRAYWLQLMKDIREIWSPHRNIEFEQVVDAAKKEYPLLSNVYPSNLSLPNKPAQTWEVHAIEYIMAIDKMTTTQEGIQNV